MKPLLLLLVLLFAAVGCCQVEPCTAYCNGDAPYCTHDCFSTGNAPQCTEFCVNTGNAPLCTNYCYNTGNAPRCAHHCNNPGNTPQCIVYCTAAGDAPLCTEHCITSGIAPLCNDFCFNTGIAPECTEYCGNKGDAPKCTYYCANSGEAPVCTHYCLNTGEAPSCAVECINDGDAPVCTSLCFNTGDSPSCTSLCCPVEWGGAIYDVIASGQSPSTLSKAHCDFKVQEVIDKFCSTGEVEVLNQQIIRHMNQRFLVKPELKLVDISGMFPNVNLKGKKPGELIPLLQKPAVDSLLNATQHQPNLKMTVNSMFRTVAQQLILNTWKAKNACGVKVAAAPSKSTHSGGIAIDVENYPDWKTILEQNGFHQLDNPKDLAHFTYQRRRVKVKVEQMASFQVMAFQELWNENHPKYPIPVTGNYNDGKTQHAFLSAPAQGFKKVPWVTSVAKRSTPPPEWTCDLSAYGSSDGCDCRCGAPDPDCVDGTAGPGVFGCDEFDWMTVRCFGDICSGDPAPTAPPEWLCEPRWYNASDECDCGCGILDPDCMDGTSALGITGCDGYNSTSVVCSAEATCEGSILPEITAPESWTCSSSSYGSSDGCDCECGAPDPDCDHVTSPFEIFGCPGYSLATLQCVHDTCTGTPVPMDWTCPLIQYNISGLCHCACGAFDPGCLDPNAFIDGCADNDTECKERCRCPFPTACVPANTQCPAGTYDHANFPATPSGSVAHGTCLTGFASISSPSRRCSQHGSWSSTIKNRCLTIKCAADGGWPKTIAGRRSTKACPPEKKGQIHRWCGDDGVWEAPKAYCH